MSLFKNTEWVVAPNNVAALETARKCDCCHQDLRPNEANAKVIGNGTLSVLSAARLCSP